MPLTTLRVIFTWFAPGLYGMSSLAWCIKSPCWAFLLWAPPNQEFSSINRSSGIAWSVHANKETHEASLTSRIFLQFLFCCNVPFGLPMWLSGKEFTSQFRRCRFDPWVRNIPWRRKWQPSSGFLPGKVHGQRSLTGGQRSLTEEPCGCKRVNLMTK